MLDLFVANLVKMLPSTGSGQAFNWYLKTGLLGLSLSKTAFHQLSASTSSKFERLREWLNEYSWCNIGRYMFDLFFLKRSFCGLFLAVIAAHLMAAAVLFADSGKVGQIQFKTPEEGLERLKQALREQDSESLIKLFGRPAKKIFDTGDPVADKAALRRLWRRFQQRADLLPVQTNMDNHEQWYKVRYGIEGWHMHIPLVSRGNGWSFATEYATAADLRVRRSLNEVATIDTLRALVQAQQKYKSQDWDGDGTFEYAARLISSPGKRDGLYWATDDYGEELSPLDGLVARAIQDGYSSDGKAPASYEGYVYKILDGQSRKTRGGEKSYLKDGKLTEGFAFLAYPLEWHASGDATFVVGVDAQVWKKDFGSRTESMVADATKMDRDHTWIRVDPVLGGKNTRKNW